MRPLQKGPVWPAEEIFESVDKYHYYLDPIDKAVAELTISASQEISKEISVLRDEYIQPNFSTNNSSQIIELIKELKEEDTTAVKTLQAQINKLISDIKKDNESATRITSPTYASIAGRHTKARDTPGPNPRTTPPEKKTDPATPPTTRPAIVVVSKTLNATHEQTLRDLKSSISFRDLTYAPARIIPVSNNKSRLEFAQNETATMRSNASATPLAPKYRSR